MANELATRADNRAPTAFSGSGVQLQTFDDAVRFAQAVHASGLAPKGFNSPQAVLVAMQAGMELGLSPMRAIQSVAVINGRPAIWGDALLGIARASGLVANIDERIEGDGESRVAVCVVTRTDGQEVERFFSVSDAKSAGLWGKSGPWQQYPSRMLQMRARSFALRDAVPEALCGFVSREEAEDHRGPDRARDITPQRQAPSAPDPLLDTLTIDQETGEVVAESDGPEPPTDHVGSEFDLPPTDVPLGDDGKTPLDLTAIKAMYEGYRAKQDRDGLKAWVGALAPDAQTYVRDLMAEDKKAVA